MVAMGQKSRSRSTQCTEDLLKQITLTAPYALRLKAAIEKVFGRKYSNHHPTKKAAEDIWLMASELARDAFADRSQENFSAYTSVNLWREGFRVLGENVQKYNERRINDISSTEDFTDPTNETRDNGVEDLLEASYRGDESIDDVFERVMEEAYS